MSVVTSLQLLPAHHTHQAVPITTFCCGIFEHRLQATAVGDVRVEGVQASLSYQTPRGSLSSSFSGSVQRV